ncbi:MAG: RloB domain-containing protein, partial [Cytophagaceae bacterium]
MFAIACEGAEREPQYFNVFQYASKRVKVDVIQDIVEEGEIEARPNNSSPRGVLEKAMRYIESEGLSDEDCLYFVIDTDRWSYEQINLLAEYCAQKPNWNLIVSNPCFEVWLYLHKRADISISESNSCKDFKSEISILEKGGYHPYKFLPYLFDAIKNAKNI